MKGGAQRGSVGQVGRLTTPPPPSRDVFAALTMQVVARFVMDVRMRETLALSVADAVGMDVSVGSVEEGWSVPSLKRSERVGIWESWTGGAMVVRRLVDRVRRVRLSEFDVRTRDWIVCRRRGGIRVIYRLSCALEMRKNVLTITSHD